MLKIGLTGNIGSGKSTVARIFEVLQVPVYHSDDIAKLILDKPEIRPEIENLFGKDIFGETGKADRKKIAAIVFNDKGKLGLLNKIIHPAVINDFTSWAANQKQAPYIIMESAILFETGYAALFDKIIAVSTPEGIRIARVAKRDAVAEEEIRMRVQNQMPEVEKTAKADFVIFNDDQQLVIPQVLKLHQRLYV